jgi:hypothetical protein
MMVIVFVGCGPYHETVVEQVCVCVCSASVLVFANLESFAPFSKLQCVCVCVCVCLRCVCVSP